MKKSLVARLLRQRWLQLFVLLGMAYLVIFNYMPMAGIIIAFNNYKLSSGILGMFTSPFVGLDHFIEFFSDYQIGDLFINTILMSITKLLFSFPLPIILALALNEVKNRLLKRTIQTVSYLPYFISWVIVYGFCNIMFTKTGVINDLIAALGGERVAFLSNPDAFLPLAVFTAVWKETGWWAIIFLAAITSIDLSLYDSAQVDGASRLQRIFYITLPGIRPTITVVLILALGNLLGGGLSGSNFEQAYLFGNAGNLERAEILQTYIMKVGLSKARYSYAAAAGLVQSLIGLALVGISNFTANKLTGEGLF
ncbi:MAG: ABC transporter permease subunit [Clostridiales bacterium]|jgi:putative aldouronate transport system permease protein|nr:ABC transporter permease subunit [Clostridiales bacterium]